MIFINFPLWLLDWTREDSYCFFPLLYLFLCQSYHEVAIPSWDGSDFFFQRVEEEALVKNSSACKDYLIEAMKYHLLPTEQRILMKSVRTRLRTPMNLPKVGSAVHTCYYLIWKAHSEAVNILLIWFSMCPGIHWSVYNSTSLLILSVEGGDCLTHLIFINHMMSLFWNRGNWYLSLLSFF